MRKWDRLLMLFGLRAEDYVRAAVEQAAKNAFLEGHAQGMTLGQQTGYQIGHAHGELHGRQKLAEELQVAHGLGDGGEKPMEPDELTNLRIRQLH